jgi:Na+/H+-dicarboxylate symporter/ABC-type amino acid transport substrate-binding protein
MSMTNRILVSLVAGVLVGLFLGEQAAVVRPAADAFVKLLQMTVLPYVTLSIIKSIGSLNLAQARTLGLRAGVVLALLWLVGLGFAFLIPLAFPHLETAMFFSTSLLERRQSFDLLDLYIPSNPFNALANNIVPAVVLFSLLVGIALTTVERKQVLLDVLQTAAEAVARVTYAIARITPFGLFAIVTAAAGTMNVEELGRLQIYLFMYVAVGLLVSLWVLPGLVAALTPIPLCEIFRLTRVPLITAFVAGDLFIVLPGLIGASQTLLSRYAQDSLTATELPDVLVPASFNFPHTGKLLSISFILFAGWFADAAVPWTQYPRLGITGLLTFFGSLNAAVPFMLDLFRIPADTFQLFLASGVINARVGALVAAVHTLTVALLGSCTVLGMLQIRRARLLRYTAITALLTLAVVGGARFVFANYLPVHYSKDQVLAGMQLLHDPMPAVVLRTPPGLERFDQAPVLQRIRTRGVLRVGYVTDALPFAFFNASGDLVGFDVELAHRLAAELHVKLEFRPVDRATLEETLSNGYCDLVMAGIAVTTLRAGTTLFSSSYLDETLAFAVPDHARNTFASWDGIRALRALTVAVPNVPYYRDVIRARLPEARIRVIDDVGRWFSAWDPAVAAIALPAERGSAWTLMYPQFSIVIPQPDIVKVPLAFPLAGHDQAFASFMNTWIDLKRKDGTIQAAYDYWILGRLSSPHPRRWSILRNVLHWTGP